MRTLAATTTVELETLHGVYEARFDTSTLTGFERQAVLRAIESELADRAAAVRSGFTCESEIERLQALLEDKDNEIFDLKMEIDELGEQLVSAKRRAVNEENSTKLKAAGQSCETDGAPAAEVFGTPRRG